MPSTGKSKELSANNCKEIKETLSTDCSQSLQNGVYWVQNQQVCKHTYVYVVMCDQWRLHYMHTLLLQCLLLISIDM